MTHLFLSNDLDILAQKLQEIIFQSNTVFQIQKILILPNSSIKDWLMQHLMKKKICMGLKFLSLEDFAKFFQADKKPLLDASQLFFELLIHAKKKSFFPWKDQKTEPDYTLSKKTLDLCHTLSQVFSTYSIYGKPNWEKTNLDWQKPIFNTLFSKENPSLIDFLSSAKPNVEGLEMHFFHLSEIPSCYLSLLERLSKKNPVYLYLFSPCQEFWQDQLSDFAHAKQQNQLSFSFEEQRNSLLGNWGKISQKLLNKLDDYSIQTTELYNTSLNDNSLLSHLKQDLLFLNFSSKDQINLENSLRIYGVGSSLLKEIEVVSDLISDLIIKKGAKPENILILAPDITPYVPHIHTFFANAPFAYRISEMNILHESTLIDAFFNLLELLQNWDKESFLKLLYNPLFCAKHALEKEEKKQMENWINEMQIRLGFSLDTKNSWESGLQRLFQAFAFHYEESFFLQSQEIHQAEILNKLLPLLYELQKDQSLFNSEKTLSGWGFALEEFLFKYVKVSSQEEETFQEFFQKALTPLKEHTSDTPFHFSTIEYYLKSRLRQKKGKFHPNYHQAVHFSSLHNAEIFPADHIIVLGMEEDSFPRKDLTTSLNALEKGPSKNHDKDRFILLQLIFFAKKSLFFTYKNLQEEDQSSVTFSLLLRELLSYIKSFYKISESQIHFQIAPLFSDKSGFMNKREFPCYKQGIYEALCQKEERAIANSIVSPFLQNPEEHSEISLEKLLSLTKNPFRFYLKEFLQISLPQKQNEIDFFLSPLEIYFFRQMLAKNQTKKAYQQLRESGKLPCSVFENLALDKLKNEEKIWKEALEAFSINPEEIHPIHIKEEITQEKWHMPPLCFSLGNKEIVVNGIVPFCTPEGILCFSEKNLQSIFSLWPYILLMHHPSYQKLNLKSQLLLVKSKSIYTCELKNPLEAWEKFLQYYFFCQKNPSLLHPSLIEGCMGKKVSLTSCIDKRLSASKVDPYLEWFFQVFSKKINEKEWEDYYKAIFEEVL